MYPLIISIGDFKIYSYPLLVGLAWGIAFQVAEYLIKRLNITFKSFKFLVVGIFCASWLGSKLFFLLFSVMDSFKDHFLSNHFWLGGGFVFYGGLFAGFLFVILYRILVDKGLSADKLIILLPALAFGHAVGRMGCLLAGCCYGKETNSFLAIYLHNSWRYPVQLYEAGLLLILGFLITRLVLNKINPRIIICIYFLYYSSMRFSLEFLRGDQIRGIFYNVLSTSQVISLVIWLITGLYLLKINISKRSL